MLQRLILALLQEFGVGIPNLVNKGARGEGEILSSKAWEKLLGGKIP